MESYFDGKILKGNIFAYVSNAYSSKPSLDLVIFIRNQYQRQCSGMFNRDFFTPLVFILFCGSVVVEVTSINKALSLRRILEGVHRYRDQPSFFYLDQYRTAKSCKLENNKNGLGSLPRAIGREE